VLLLQTRRPAPMRLVASARLPKPVQLAAIPPPRPAPARIRSWNKNCSAERPGRRLSAMKAAAARDAGGAPVADASDTAYKERVRDMWAKRGATYDTNNTFHPPLCEQLVALAGIRPGAAVLDVATGTGKRDVPAAADTARARMQCPVTS